MPHIRALFLADSHLGLDLPTSPRVQRRRRGHDFLANHSRILDSALHGDIDLVIHGGDVFDRPNVPADLARLAYAPLLRVADRGIPVFITPGNHERSRLPHARLLAHPHVHVFDSPRTFHVEVRGVRLALSGFPYERKVRHAFGGLVERTGWRERDADARLLCVHHCVEGATVGPGDFTFTTAADVIRCRDIPTGFHALLSGHIHRHQVLTQSLAGDPLRTPVLYPGSLERTATAEIGEPKGYLLLDIAPGSVRWTFREVYARPMQVVRLRAGSADGRELDRALRATVASAPADAVLVVRIDGGLSDAHLRLLSASAIRSLAPPTMNVEVRAEQLASARRSTRPAKTQAAAAARAPGHDGLRDEPPPPRYRSPDPAGPEQLALPDF